VYADGKHNIDLNTRKRRRLISVKGSRGEHRGTCGSLDRHTSPVVEKKSQVQSFERNICPGSAKARTRPQLRKAAANTKMCARKGENEQLPTHGYSRKAHLVLSAAPEGENTQMRSDNRRLNGKSKKETEAGKKG